MTDEEKFKKALFFIEIAEEFIGRYGHTNQHVGWEKEMRAFLKECGVPGYQHPATGDDE
jgi:hypothetical protein